MIYEEFDLHRESKSGSYLLQKMKDGTEAGVDGCTDQVLSKNSLTGNL